MSASISVAIDGVGRIEQRLNALARSFEDLSPLMDGIATYLESSTVDRFDSESAPDGSKWSASKRAKEQGGKTLTDSARLRLSITGLGRSREAEVGTNVIYAGVHNDGFNGQVSVPAHVRTVNSIFGRPLSGGLSYRVGAFQRHMVMPKRQFLGISSLDETEILALTEDYARMAAPEIDG